MLRPTTFKQIWSSITSRSKDGSFAVVITQGSANNPFVFSNIKAKRRDFTGSFEEEKVAKK